MMEVIYAYKIMKIGIAICFLGGIFATPSKYYICKEKK